ncbi:hypothetical protein D3C81_1048830 [compost metagenome]
MLTVSRARSGTDSSTGSLTSGAPGAMLAAGWPENVSVRRLPASMAEPAAARATVAAPMRSGALPYAFDSTMRTRGPPTLRRATWRTVCPCSTAGTLLGNRKSLRHTAWGLAVQLASQEVAGSTACAAGALSARLSRMAGKRDNRCMAARFIKGNASMMKAKPFMH